MTIESFHQVLFGWNDTSSTLQAFRDIRDNGSRWLSAQEMKAGDGDGDGDGNGDDGSWISWTPVAGVSR